MKSTYQIKQEMETRFGKDFIDKMNREKVAYEKYRKELADAQTFEEKVQEKTEELQKDFIYISDNFNIYPEETCSSHLLLLAQKLVKEKCTPEQEKELIAKAESDLLDSLEEDAQLLLKAIKIERERK